MFDGKIKMTSDFACSIVGIVSIKLRTHDDIVCILIEVRYVPLMSTKHLSSSQVENVGNGFSMSTWIQM